MGGRHRHAVNVRTDGLAAVLGQLTRDPRIRVAALVDVDSGMVLDSCGPDAGPETAADVEIRCAAHAEIVRTALVVAPGPERCEIVVRAGDGSHHVLHPVPDPHGDRLALAVVVHGSAWLVARLRRRLRTVSAAALTAGPSTALRPTAEGWRPDRLREPAPPPPRFRRPAAVAAATAALHGVPEQRRDRTATDRRASDPGAGNPDRAGSGTGAAGAGDVDATGPRLPAMTRLPPPGPGPVRAGGSTWTTPPAPSTPPTVAGAVARTATPASGTSRPGTVTNGSYAAAGSGRDGPAPDADPPDRAPSGRPAPPSALPPGSRTGRLAPPGDAQA